MKYIVVPEGLSVSVTQTVIPSFVFRQIIEYLALIISNDDEIYFAPANSFGLGVAEQIIGKIYLQEINNNEIEIEIFSLDHLSKGYINTLGNATLLLKQFPELTSEKTELICGNIHAKRAFLCFKSVGFNINKLHQVKYETVNEKIVRRLWYYKYPQLHELYEKLAYYKDLLTLIFNTKQDKL